MTRFPRVAALAAAIASLVACSLSAIGEPAASGAPPAGTPGGGVLRTPGEVDTAVWLRSDRRGTRWRGRQRIAFTNTGSIPLHRIWLRIWSNGPDGCEPLAIRLGVTAGGTLGAPLRACTAYPVDLDGTLAPGERTRLRLSLRIRTPARNDRFGAHGGMALLGGALPVPAIHDDAGWHLDPYVDLGESFYSLAAGYRVTLNVPDDLDTAATGRIAERTEHAGRETRTYVARNVREFAWAAARFSQLIAHADGVTIRVWFRPGLVSRSRARTVERNAVDSLRTFDDAFGRYPYPEVDLVVSAFRTFGGMEYPQIVFTNPDALTVAHELAHQWWWGLVGNDEYAEPWLDESLATWSMYLPYRPWRSCGSFRWPSPQARISNDMGYWGDHLDEYQTIYSGGGCMLAQLASRFGLARFREILGTYAAAHRYGIARTEDLQGAVADAAATWLPGFDLDTFWQRWRLTPAP
ncbi:MAG TPA: M1 family metallopeptidase [Actinomycetota bacterium]|jgi:hypothetical protein